MNFKENLYSGENFSYFPHNLEYFYKYLRINFIFSLTLKVLILC